MPIRLRRVARRLLTSCALAGLMLGGSVVVRGAGWEAKPDPPAGPIKLEVKPGLAIPVPSGNTAIFPTTPSPFVALGQNKAEADSREVWDLRDGSKVATIQGKIKSGSKEVFRLSPDGKYLAARVGEASAVPAVEVWSFATGKLVRRIDPKPGAKDLNVFDFAGRGQLAIVNLADSNDKRIQFYNIESGDLVTDAPTAKGFVEDTLTFSPGGNYFAYTAENLLRVQPFEKGKPVSDIALTNLLGGALAFSPDGGELAGLFFEGAGGRLLAWDMARGEKTVDHQVGGAPTFSVGGRFLGSPRIDWLPDGSAWLLADHALVDRQDGRWVWSLLPPEKSILGLKLKVVDNDHAVGVLGGGPTGAGSRLETITLPWPQIDASLKAMRSDGRALLRPGQAVSLKITMGNVRESTPQAAQVLLTKAITEALASQGIKVADKQQVVLHLRHGEAEGAPLTLRKMGEPRTPGSGTTVHASQFTDEFVLTDAAKVSKPLWFEAMKETYAPFGLVRGEVSDKSLRDGAFQSHLRRRITKLVIPYFIPADGKLSMLPGSSIPTPSAVGRPGLATPKATTRGQAR